MEITKAKLEHADQVAHLFDLYRQYYECAPDLNLSTQFIKQRIENADSDIFIALSSNKVRGFVQLYPTLCSIAAANIYIVHDLFVDAGYRKTGVGKKLMNKATQWAKDNGAARLDLLTEKTNTKAQSLYEKLGYKKSLEDFYAYSLDMPK